MKEALVFAIMVFLALVAVKLLFRFLHLPDLIFRILLLFAIVLVAFSTLMFLTGIYRDLPVLNGMFGQIKTLVDWIIMRITS